MTTPSQLLPALVSLCACAAHAGEPLDAPSERRRIAVVAAATEGGGERAALRYAVADAELMAAALVDVGAVRPDDLEILLDVDVRSLETALAAIPARVVAARASARRVEVVFYYSGHSDEAGLLLGRSVYPWAALRVHLKETGADLAIVVVDSCSSGALTRKKGGATVAAAPPLLGADVRGLAIVTSASASELAQESPTLGGSFFTHALVTGMRGAADEDDDGHVTIDEAYTHAYHATLAHSETTSGGPQHATHELELRGTGQVALSDVRRATGALVLDEAVPGRFSVYDPRGRNVAEGTKPAARNVTVSLPPGAYSLVIARAGAVARADVELVAAAPVAASSLRFRQLAPHETVARGIAPTLSVRGRALAEERYQAEAIRMQPNWLGDVAVQGPADLRLEGSALYRAVDRPDLIRQAQERADCQCSMVSTGAALATVGMASFASVIIMTFVGDGISTDEERSIASGLLLTSPIGLVGGCGTAALGAAIPLDPLSGSQRAMLVEQHNREKRRELGLPPSPSADAPSAAMAH